ncbi:DUF1194 domain-containing protein [Minwuia sp.]|uniref:DUF1194 domain-containing protein n=1 Tax=Minwuia sp. TaxID=2493630 RepID=UPI003A8EC700
MAGWLSVVPASAQPSGAAESNAVPDAAAASVPIDLELLIAMDVSHSVTFTEHQSQIEGVARAFEHPRLINAIRNLPGGSAAVALMLWAGPENQLLAVPWMAISDDASAFRFAAALRRQTEPPWKGLSFTAIGDALLQGADALSSNRFRGTRRVIDLSGDDPSNQGVDVAEARDLVVLQGIVINGLPILQDRSEHEDREKLVRYFEKEVVGGHGHFVIPTVDFHDFPRAMLAKLITEVSGTEPDRTDQFAWQHPSGPDR